MNNSERVGAAVTRLFRILEVPVSYPDWRPAGRQLSG